MQEVKDLKYYSSRNVEELFGELSSGKNGLSESESKSRLKEGGYNIFSEKKRYNIFVQFISHFKSPFILILLAAAGISFFVGQTTQGIIIACIILLGATLDFVQEYSANKALIKLIETVKTKATVLRNGKKVEIPLKDIVAGDIVFLSSGDMVPADARVVEAEDFFVNQASITGESFPIEKISGIIESKAGQSTSDLDNILFSGTNVVGGSALALIVKTGKETEFGKIASHLAQSSAKSEFEKGVGNFGFFLMKIALVLVLFIFLVNSLIKHDVFESFMFAIAIAVGITPDLLPVIMSVTMAVGSRKMSKKGVIVKKLSAIPNFGSMNILCTDKTGTLTENKITLVKYMDFKGKEDENVLKLTYLNSSFQTGIKNPLDEAVLSFRKVDIKGFKKIGEIPYDFSRKRMSVIVSDKKQNMIITKGATEEIFECCRYYNRGGRSVTFEKRSKAEAMKVYKDLSSQGYRVLAVASKSVEKGKHSHKEESEMTFEGFVSFFDPPKKDVKKTLEEIEKLGIEIKIITGDNELVSKKIADEVGLRVKGIILGKDMEKMSEEALKIKAGNATIFARCSPSQKIRIINALREGGNVVGYIGDGINDAPSLKACDVSISVNNAVDVAKESADIILTRKSLADLKEGVIDGRKTFGNTMKYIMMALSSNFGNMFSASGAILFLPYLPMLPVQILLNNLIYDSSQITLPSDRVDNDWVSNPKKWDIKFLKKFMYTFGPLSSVFDFATFFIFYFALKVSAPVFQTGWFIESLATQLLVIHVIRTKKTPILKSRASKLLVLSSLLGVALGFVIPYTALGKWFGFAPLPWHFVLIILGIVAVYLVAVEITKRIFYRRNSF